MTVSSATTEALTLADWAARADASVRGDASVRIDRIAAVSEADERTLTFATDEHFLRAALASKAAAVLTESALAEKLGASEKPLLLVPSVRPALATLLRAFQRPQPCGPFRHPMSVVDESAEIGDEVWIGPFVTIGARARIGDGSVLHAGVVIGEDARIGRRAVLYPRSMLLDGCIAGDDVVLKAGAVVGGEGFGWAFIDGRMEKIPQIGNVELGNNVEIGSNSTVDRAQTGTTRIGDGTKIDNLCQIGHNCRIGKHSVFAAFSGAAGSAIVGDYVQVGAQAGINGHITVGSRVRIAGRSEVWGDVADGMTISGAPAGDHRMHLRQMSRLRKIETLYARVEALEKKASNTTA